MARLCAHSPRAGDEMTNGANYYRHRGWRVNSLRASWENQALGQIFGYPK